jgi:putative ABC transport system permease protein
MLKNHIRVAFRNLGKGKVTNAINIFGLSLSMTAAVLIALWVQNELSFDSYHPKSGNIYRITSHIKISGSETWSWETAPMLLGDYATKEIPGVERIAKVNPAHMEGLTISVNGIPFKQKNSVYVDSNWFRLFHYDFAEGNAEAFFSQPYSVLLTESVAKKYFGKGKAVGKMVRIDTANYEVQAVVKDNPVNSSFRFELMMPLSALLANPKTLESEQTWGYFNYITFLQLSNGVSTKKVEKLLNTILVANKKDSSATATLLPLTTMHFDQEVDPGSIEHSNIKTVYIFEILAALLLIVACINYVNFTTARAGTRIKEVSIRKIVGAPKMQLFIQFISETTFICLLALVITVLLLYASLPFFNELTERQFVLRPSDPVLYKIVGGALAVTVLLNGIYPALLLSSFKPINIFRGVSVLKVKDVTLRKGLVVAQFAISFVLIAGAIIMFKQLQYIQQKEPGYSRSQVFEISLPFSQFRNHTKEARQSALAAFKQELQAQSTIQQVSSLSQSVIDLRSTHSGSLDWDGRDTTDIPSVTQLSADEDLQQVLGMQLAAGRWFEAGNKADYKNVILNETAVRQFNIRKPVIGQRFNLHGDTGRIIGITKDFHFKSLHDKISPLVIFNNANWRGTFYIKTTAGQAKQAVAAVEKAWKQFIPAQPFEYAFLDDQFNALYRKEKKVSSLMAVFAGLAIVVSCLGLLGLAMFTAEQRTKEIGIRKVLGATLSNIMLLLSKDFVWLVLIGTVVATPVAWWAMNRWLEDFAYRTPISTWIFILAGIFALLVAIVTVSLQAIKTATANPVNSLRTQ